MHTPPATGAQAGPHAITHSDLLLRLLFQALRVNDEALNAAAAELLVQFGTKPVPRLIRVALDRKNRRPHRLRALTLLGRIGQLLRRHERCSIVKWLLRRHRGR
ncbi:hypothetical protein R5W23_005888, partial [Gemmata sp. JC673]